MQKTFSTIVILALVLTSAIAWAQSPISTRQVQIQLNSPPQSPAIGSAGVIGGSPGPQVYYYWVVAQFTIGASSPGGPFRAIQVPSTLNGSNYVTISWAPVFGATSYDLLRTTTGVTPSGVCACAVATGVTGTTTNDQSNSLSAYTVSAIDPGEFAMTLTNEAVGAGSSHLILRQGANSVDLSTTAGAVLSVFGRTGAIGAQNGDYNAGQVTNAFNLAGNNAFGAFYLDWLPIAAPANPASGCRVYIDNATGTLSGKKSDGSSCAPTGGSMVYPPTGVPNSTGAAWGASYAVGTSPNNLVQLTAAGKMPAVDGSLLTNLPSGFANPMNAIGDMIGGGTAGAGVRIPAGKTGQTIVATNSATPSFASPGLKDGNSGSPVTTTPYAVQCDSATAIVDRYTVIALSTGASVVTNPDSTGSGCTGNFTYGLDNGSGGTVTVNRSGADTFDVYTGSSVSTGQTSFTLGNGQFARLRNGRSTVWSVNITQAGQPAMSPTTLTDGATITWAIASNPFATATVTLGGNRTLNITNPVSGATYILKIVQDATGSRTLTLGTGCTWKVINGGAGAITLTTTANAVDTLSFWYDGTNCNANLGKNYN